jgi:hypothetical protein
MNFQAVEAANGNSVPMQGTFVEIGGAQYTANQKAKAICKVRDMTGVSHNVHVYKGKGFLPGPQNLNQRYEFSLSTFQGQYQGQPYTGYSGFWNANGQQVQQQQQAPPYQAPQAPPQQAQQPNKPDWDAISRGKVRCNVVCAYIQSGQDMPGITEINDWVEYIMVGQSPGTVSGSASWNPENEPQGAPQADDIPF